MLSLNRLIRFTLLTVCLFVAGISLKAEEEKENQAAHPSWEGMTSSMEKSMDPNIWSQMMATMMDPQKSSPIATCVLCHESEDMARYQKDFGPMMEAMWQPYKAMMNPHMMSSMMNPNVYTNMMGPMMNPAMYMNMMNPMMGMLGPMMGMGGGGMMNPAMYMNMMYPMMGMLGPMMGMGGGSMMNPAMYMNMMNPMMGGMGMHGGSPMGQMPGGQMINPKQYEEWFAQWSEMMKNFAPQTQQSE